MLADAFLRATWACSSRPESQVASCALWFVPRDIPRRVSSMDGFEGVVLCSASVVLHVERHADSSGRRSRRHSCASQVRRHHRACHERDPTNLVSSTCRVSPRGFARESQPGRHSPHGVTRCHPMCSGNATRGGADRLRVVRLLSPGGRLRGLMVRILGPPGPAHTAPTMATTQVGADVAEEQTVQ